MKRCFLIFFRINIKQYLSACFLSVQMLLFCVPKTQETYVRAIVIIVVPHYSTSISRKCRTIDSCSSNDFVERRKNNSESILEQYLQLCVFWLQFYTVARALTLVVAPFLSLVRSLPLVFSRAQKKKVILVFFFYLFSHSHKVSSVWVVNRTLAVLLLTGVFLIFASCCCSGSFSSSESSTSLSTIQCSDEHFTHETRCSVITGQVHTLQVRAAPRRQTADRLLRLALLIAARVFTTNFNLRVFVLL